MIKTRLIPGLILLGLLPVVTVAAGPESPRQKVAILTFESKSEQPIDADILTETYQTELVNQPRRPFSLVERTQLAKIFQEQKLQLAGLTETEAVKIGNIAGASVIILVTIGDWQDRFILNLKGIDTTTAEIRFAERAETWDAQGLMELLPLLAERTVRRYNGETLAPIPPDQKSRQRVQDQKSREKQSSSVSPVSPVSPLSSDRERTVKSRRTTETPKTPAPSRPAQKFDLVWKRKDMALEIGGLKLDPRTSDNAVISGNSIYGFRFAMKLPGAELFQFIMGMDYFFGNLTKTITMDYLVLYPQVQFNPLFLQFFQLGLGAGIHWGFGTFNFTTNSTKYDFPYSQAYGSVFANAGIHITENILIQFEWGMGFPFPVSFDSPSRDYRPTGSATNYQVPDTDGDPIIVPQALYNLKDGFAFNHWALKLDFLLD